MNVLIVDDHEDFLESFATLCRLWGHEVQELRQPEEALAVALVFQPDVVFLDLQMPGLSGYDIAQQMRQHSQLDGVILIALTGNGLYQDRERSKAAGFDAHLLKPVDPLRLKQFLGEPTKRPDAAWIEELERLERKLPPIPDQD